MSAVAARPPRASLDLQTGLKIIACLPLANPQQALTEIKGFLDGLLNMAPDVDDHLDLLEQLRPSFCFVVEELARQFVNKPLPLGEIEESCFRQVIISCIKMARSYARCATLVTSVKYPGDPSRIALILHRCIYYTGTALIEHHRARRELPPELWLDLHAYYASAEKLGIAALSVADALDPQGRSTHCSSVFLCLLLFELAGPYSLSLRDQNVVRNWADNWSQLVSLHPLVSSEPMPSLVIDFMRNASLCSSANSLNRKHLRRLDTSALVSHLKHLRQQLSKKMSPKILGIGDGGTSRQCRRLLKRLSSPWSLAYLPRTFLRRAASGDVRLVIGFEATHGHIPGPKFTPPKNDCADPQQNFESHPVAAHRPQGMQQSEVRQESFGAESERWAVVNQSANGYRLKRMIGGGKIAHGQLLALCPHDGGRFLLAQAIWLIQERQGGLLVGVAALSGMPQAIAIRRLTGDGGQEDADSHAFMLSAVSTKGEPSLVIPQGWYRADRIIETNSDLARRVKLKRVISEGPDFEHVSFVVE